MLSDKLKKLRENMGLDQKDVAEKLNIQQGSYSNYERGKRTPDIETLKKIADFYNVSADFLLGKSNENESNIIKLERELTIEQKELLESICKLIFPVEYKKIDN